MHLLAQTVPVTDTYLDLGNIATRLGIARNSARVYHTRATRNRRNGVPKPGDLPAPDILLAGHPGWLPGTIDRWEQTRPGRGTPDPAARREWLQQHRAALLRRDAELQDAIQAITRELGRLDGGGG